MRRIMLAAVFVLFCLCSFGQIKFESGYYIDNTGKKIECFIRNPDRAKNPTQFIYRLTPEGETKTASIESVQEFEILNTIHRYKRFNVKLETSTNDLKSLGERNELTFVDAVLFLRIAVEGKASLFVYNPNSGDNKFFYSLNSHPEQLIYYKFLEEDTKIDENNQFKKQLLDNLKCSSVTPEILNRIHYNEKDLTDVFVDYNECEKSIYTNYSKRKQKGQFGLILQLGMHSASLEFEQTIRQSGAVNYTSFDTKISPSAGLDIEYVLPLNKGKWAVNAEPNVQVYNAKKETAIYYTSSSSPSSPQTGGAASRNLVVNYTHLNLPFGIRHYAYLNDKVKLFFNAAIAYNLLLNKSIALKVENLTGYPSFEQESFKPLPNFVVGVGAQLKNKFTVKAQLQLGKKMLDNKDYRASFKNVIGVIAGYRL